MLALPLVGLRRCYASLPIVIIETVRTISRIMSVKRQIGLSSESVMDEMFDSCTYGRIQ